MFADAVWDKVFTLVKKKIVEATQCLSLTKLLGA